MDTLTALNYAIFALNHALNPDGSDGEDLDKLEIFGEDAIERLAKIRDRIEVHEK